MDRNSAVDYHTTLRERLADHSKSDSIVDFILFLGGFAVVAYFAVGGVAGAMLGALIGWGFQATFARINDVKREIVFIEFLRHLHEHTDEADEGQRIAQIKLEVRKAAKKWWWP